MAKKIVGEVFGELVVLARMPRTGKRKEPYWLCRCSCGRLTEVGQKNLLEKTRSCGCRRIQALNLMAAKERSRVDRRDKRLGRQFPGATSRAARRVPLESPAPALGAEDFSDL
ncbi:MAG: hypothetical protein EOM37_15175 [Proteobacteria bacterium]|nr:hypothetical protein [Pseudomonadota bacterium]